MIEHDMTGLLVPPSDNAALADAMQQLLMDPFRAARLGKGGSPACCGRFYTGAAIGLSDCYLGKASLPHSATKATPLSTHYSN